MSSVRMRKPVVAGQFYPSSAKEIKLQVSGFLGQNPGQKTSALACVLPHAGYIYSGKVAALTLANINIPKTVILLGPNHTGQGVPFSIMKDGVWQTPLGDVEINSKLAAAILKDSSYLQEDSLAHMHEHSLEVELPLIQYFRPDFDFVPIVISSNNIRELKQVGREISEAVLNSGIRDSVLLVASSDMTHYEPQDSAEKKDKAAIDAILQLDEDKLMNKIEGLDISMCGYMPAIVMLAAVKLLGASSAQLIKYQTSGDVTEDKSSVVGYAGIVIR